ncbi:unnamed protein product [Gordionus sp. m RMFG-2023]
MKEAINALIKESKSPVKSQVGDRNMNKKFNDYEENKGLSENKRFVEMIICHRCGWRGHKRDTCVVPEQRFKDGFPLKRPSVDIRRVDVRDQFVNGVRGTDGGDFLQRLVTNTLIADASQTARADDFWVNPMSI